MISGASLLVFVVWISLFNRGESKQACPVGLLSSGVRREFSGVIKREKKRKKKKLVTAEVPESVVQCSVFYRRCM